LGVVGILYLTAYLKTPFLDIFSPFFKISSSTLEFITDNLSYLKSKKDLEEENKLLKKQVQILNLEKIKARQLEVENEALKKALNFVGEKQLKDFVIAKVIAFSPDNWINSIILNVGEKDGVKEGDLVIQDGYLIGILWKVGKYSSSVLTVADKDFKITARTRKTGEIVYYQGYNQYYGILKYARPEQDIRISDIIETAGMNETSLNGIPIGIIRDISLEEGRFFKEIKIRHFFNPYKLDYLIVLKNKEIR